MKKFASLIFLCIFLSTGLCTSLCAGDYRSKFNSPYEANKALFVRKIWDSKYSQMCSQELHELSHDPHDLLSHKDIILGSRDSAKTNSGLSNLLKEEIEVFWEAYSKSVSGRYLESAIDIDPLLRFNNNSSITAHLRFLFLMDAFFKLPLVNRDVDYAKKLRNTAIDFVKANHMDQYSKEIAFMICRVDDLIVSREIEIANFYERKGNCLAAVNHLKEVAIVYPEHRYSSYVHERLRGCLKKMGIIDGKSTDPQSEEKMIQLLLQ